MTDPIAVDQAGVISEDTAAQIQALYVGHTITPTAPFTYSWNGVLISFNTGDTLEVEPGLLAALTAAGAPFTQP